jgi:hypothetical protein
VVKDKRKVTAKAESGKGTAAAQNNARTPCLPPTRPAAAQAAPLPAAALACLVFRFIKYSETLSPKNF